MKLLAVTEGTLRRISARHDRRWFTLADNDVEMSPAAYFSAMGAQLLRQQHGIDE